MPYGNQYGMTQPSNNLWVGNNYANGFAQASRSPMGGMSPQMMQQPMGMSQAQTINNVLQVMGPESAQSYQVGPNSHVILMDSNRPVFYTKRSDDSGYSETKAYKFEEIPLMSDPMPTQSQQVTQPDMSEYMTRSEFEEFKKTIEELVMNNV